MKDAEREDENEKSLLNK